MSTEAEVMNNTKKHLDSLYEKLGSNGEMISKELAIYDGDLEDHRGKYKKNIKVFTLLLYIQSFAFIAGVLMYMSEPEPRYFTTSYNGDVFEIDESKITLLNDAEAKKLIIQNKRKFNEREH